MASQPTVNPASANTVAEAPSPQLFWETANAYQRTAALRAAVELDVFTAIGEGHDTVEQMAGRCEASPRGLRILCDYLTIVGFLRKSDNRYSLTVDSATFLDRRSPASMGGILKFVNSPELTGAYNQLTDVVRKGTTQMSGAGVVDTDDSVWLEFAHTMLPLVMPAAEFIGQLVTETSKGPIRVLDIAAGHGMFGIEIARRAEDAHIVALDWARVLEVARQNARAAGVDSRFDFLAGDAFQIDFGREYDAVLITNFFHHFDQESCRSLIRKVFEALKPDGRAFTLEFVPDEDRIRPAIPASFAMMMLGVTPAGDAYTFREYDEMFRGNGFSRNEILAVPRSPQQVIVSYKA